MTIKSPDFQSSIRINKILFCRRVGCRLTGDSHNDASVQTQEATLRAYAHSQGWHMVAPSAGNTTPSPTSAGHSDVEHAHG